MRIRNAMTGLGALLAVGLLGACPPPIEPAPEDLNGVAHWLWSNYQLADDAAMGDAFQKLHQAVDGDALEESQRGTLVRLQKEELAWVGLDHKDPKKAVGIYVVNHVDCDMGTLEEILYERDQKQFFPEAYQEYDRQYTSDFDAYAAREDPFLTWHVDIDATITGGPISVPYSESIDGGIRYVAEIDEESTPFGPILLTHTYMPEPATFEDDVNEWPLDFQISAYYEVRPNEVVQFYGIWREMFFGGVGLGTDDSWVQSTQLDSLVSWHERFEEICVTWPDVP